MHKDVVGKKMTADEVLEEILKDMFLYDLKIMDDDLHKKYTNVSNRIIHEAQILTLK